MNVGKAIDKAAGAEREILSSVPMHDIRCNSLIGKKESMTYDYTAPATPEAQQWNGHGTALKPAHEPIVLARKPLEGTVARNVLKHGVGGLNIEECRISTKDDLGGGTPNGTSNQIYGRGLGKGKGQPSGRFPANIIHDGLEELGSAARYFYCSKTSPSERKGNPHPTVKPLKLMEYLVKLVKQPSRNLILDPFAGSGSTLLACQALCIPCIGIELEESYCRIIVERLSNLKARKSIGCSSSPRTVSTTS